MELRSRQDFRVLPIRIARRSWGLIGLKRHAPTNRPLFKSRAIVAQGCAGSAPYAPPTCSTSSTSQAPAPASVRVSDVRQSAPSSRVASTRVPVKRTTWPMRSCANCERTRSSAGMRLKAHKKYEFGVKVSLAVTQRDHFIVGALALPGNPFDGHTLPAALRQVERLTGTQPERCFVDRGYRGHGIEDISVHIAGQKRGTHPSTAPRAQTPQRHRAYHRAHQT